MLRHYLIAAITLGLVATGFAYAQPANDSAGETNLRQAQTEPTPAPQPSVTATLERELGRIARALDAREARENSFKEEDRDRRNLVAQEDMAYWSPWMLGVMFAEMVITLAGVVLIGVTLRYTARTLEEARDATAAARDAAEAAKAEVNETRRIGEAQVRAYVDIKQAKLVFTTLVPTAEADHDQPLISIAVINTGDTPARKFRWNPVIQYFVGTHKTQGEMLSISKQTTVEGARIAAGQTHEDHFLVSGMPLNKIVADSIAKLGGGIVKDVLVRLKIEFEFTDVFETKIEDAAYFSGLFSHQSRDMGLNLKMAGADWVGRLDAMGEPKDWDQQT